MCAPRCVGSPCGACVGSPCCAASASRRNRFCAQSIAHIASCGIVADINDEQSASSAIASISGPGWQARRRGEAAKTSVATTFAPCGASRALLATSAARDTPSLRTPAQPANASAIHPRAKSARRHAPSLVSHCSLLGSKQSHSSHRRGRGYRLAITRCGWPDHQDCPTPQQRA